MNYSWEIVKIVFYLIIISAVIYLLARFLKNFYLRPGGGENMALIEQLYLDSKKSLQLVRVKDKVLLISVSENEIKLLDQWPRSEFSDIDNPPTADRADFKTKFKEYMGQYRRGSDE